MPETSLCPGSYKTWQYDSFNREGTDRCNLAYCTSLMWLAINYKASLILTCLFVWSFSYLSKVVHS